jgi:hypothetical protein
LKLASLVLALLAIIAGVAAGCGDDDDDEAQTLSSGASGATGEAGATDLDGFIAAADEICTEANRELAQEARSQYPEGPPTGDDAVAFAEDVFIPNLQEQHDAIAALPVPEGDEEAIDDVLSKLQSAIDELADDPEGFVTSDALATPAKAASDLGLRACGQ